MKNPWKLVKENIIYQNKFGYTLHDDDVITPGGKPGKFMVLESHDFAVIVAITSDNKIIMIRQWRYAMGRECFELPAGSINKGEDNLVAAKRELKEETGATSDNWQELKSYWLGNGAMRIKGHIFLAKDAKLSGEAHNDETENTIVETHPYPYLMKMVDQNIITDERSLLGLLLVEKYL
jgi:ADP-ribose pyrophosphatase